MKLTDKAVEEFGQLYIKDTKVELGDEDARKEAESLMRLFLLLHRVPYVPPKSNDNLDELEYALGWKKHRDGPAKVL
jgi:hypothetical protein